MEKIRIPRQKERLITLDITRTLAIALIVLCHSVDTAEALQQVPNLKLWIPLHAVARLGVPLFLMISGMLLLGRDYKNPLPFWLKRLPQFIFLTFFVAYGETWFDGLLSGKSNLTLNSFLHALPLTELRHGHTGAAYQLWYMYAIISLYIIVPAISTLVKEMSLLAAVVFITVCILGSFDFTGKEHHGSSTTNLVGCYGIYFMLGYYISVLTKDHLKKVPAFVFYILSALTIIILDYKASKSWNGDIDHMMWYKSLYLLFSSGFLFTGLVKSSIFFERICSFSLRNLFRFISEGSFSIFLYHLLWIIFLRNFGAYVNHLPLIILIGLYFVGAIIVGLIPFFFLRKTPILKKLVS